jgi:hypothetical protein
MVGALQDVASTRDAFGPQRGMQEQRLAWRDKLVVAAMQFNEWRGPGANVGDRINCPYTDCVKTQI